MTGYGSQILQAHITDLDPNQRVKNAMNEINVLASPLPYKY